MSVAALSFGISSHYTPGIEALEDTYQKAHKKIIAFFYNHPLFLFSWAFSGVQLEYYAKKHPEFTDTLRELVARKQLELLGGGYYEPVFPLLTTADCITQIEMLTALQHSLVGPRPRGIALSDCWDPRLITPFNKCKMNFVQLDASMMGERTRDFQPLIAEHLGKTISVLPVYSDLLPGLNTVPLAYLDRLSKVFSKIPMHTSKNPVAVCMLTPGELVQLIESGWLDEFSSHLSAYSNRFQLTTPSQFFTKSTVFAPVYIPPGSKNRPCTANDLIHADRDLRLLYARMMHVCLMVSQCRGDKVRKKTAEGKLLEAQFGGAYTPRPDGDKVRKAAYRCLIQAEKIARGAGVFSATATSFDFDFDGINEYICRFDSYNAFIEKAGGTIFELDVFRSAANYAGKYFSDFLIPPDDFERFSLGTLADQNAFWMQHYTELLFDRSRKEIRLEVSGQFGEQKQKTVLRKNYRVYDNGLQVQYILKNESEAPLKAVFAIESFLAISSEKPDDCKIEIITEQRNEVINSAKDFLKTRNVTYVQVTDVPNNVSFVTEPNEKSGFVFNPVVQSIRCVHFWNIELGALKETEKTVNLTIITPKKRLKR
jgi:hypothetical protein